MSTFRDFRDSHPAVEMVKALLGLDMSPLRSWSEFTEAALAARPAVQGDFRPFIDRIERRAGTASTGELALLMAVLYAMDYRWLAEQIAENAGRSFMRLMEYTSGDHARAAAACIERHDDGPSAFDEFDRERLSEWVDELDALGDRSRIGRVVKTLGKGAFSNRGLEQLVVIAKSSERT